MKLNVILTGASGMVGEGVLLECLQNPEVEKVLVIGRKSCGHQHPKMQEILHADFFNIEPLRESLRGHNACFFCLGVSSVGMKEPEYTKLTHTLTTHFAQVLSEENSDMVFCYISGAGTDSSEQGRMMWARVKGKTENDLMKMNFKRVYAVRPGMLTPSEGMKNTLPLYKYFAWMAPIMRLLAPNRISSLKQLGLGMIRAASQGYEKQHLEVRDIKKLAG